MRIDETVIGGRKCYCCMRPEAGTLLIQAVDDHDLAGLERQLESIADQVEGIPFSFCAFKVESWFADLSPWKAPAVFGQQSFGDGAGATLEYVEHELIPSLAESSAFGQTCRRIIGGYSLAGLFALYAAYESQLFGGCAAVSPSVWFPGWDEYIDTHDFGAEYVYLSLGNREEKTKNRQMATVGDRIRLQADRLQALPQVNACILEWNEGNHFRGPELRTARGFAWLLRRINRDQVGDVKNVKREEA